MQDHVAVPRASVMGVEATGVQVTAPAGVMVGPVDSSRQQQVVTTHTVSCTYD